jgi:hypothetical protein
MSCDDQLRSSVDESSTGLMFYILIILRSIPWPDAKAERSAPARASLRDQRAVLAETETVSMVMIYV